MKKLYLVENYAPGLKFDDNSLIIGLTPLACHQLEKAGVDYKIWENYVNVSEFINQYSKYHHERKLWLKEFDEFLMEIFPQIKSIQLPLATTYHIYLRNIIDSLILRAKELQILFKKIKPDQVIYVSCLPQKDIINFTLLFRGNIESLFSRLAPLICKKCNILFEKITVPSNNKNGGAKKLFIKRLLNIQDIKKIISSKKLLKILCNDLEIIGAYVRAKKNNYPVKSVKTNILFLEQNSYIRKIMAEAIRAGYRVYYRFNNSIIRQYHGFHLTKYRINDKKKGVEFAPNLEIALKKLKRDTNLINWLNQVCGINIESVILPRLLHFIEVTSPEVIFWANEYAKIYNRLKIQFVFLSHCSTPSDHAAIAACKYSQKIKVGYINHGDDALNNQQFFDDYVSLYDIFFISNDELAGYLQKRKTAEKFKTKILQAPIRYTILPIKKSLKPEIKKNKPRVVFVPTMYPWDNNSWTGLYPDTWYFHWHKRLLKLFSEKTNFEFIWKALPVANETYDPILDIIKEKKYRNVRYETAPFVNWISKADRFLSDYPSTSLYEAAFSELPVMSLYFKPFYMVRETAAEMFGKSLQPFSNFSEGIQKISTFLDTSPSRFVVDIPYSKESFTNLLNGIYEKSKRPDK